MFHFNMKITQNFAHFIDETSGISVFVDSFDNEEFEVRLGDMSASEYIGTLVAKDDKVLNSGLENLVIKKLH